MTPRIPRFLTGPDRWAVLLTGLRDRPLVSSLFLITPTVAAAGLHLVGPGQRSVPEILIAVAAALALLLRRRWPLPVLVVATLSLVLILDLVPVAVAAYAIAAAPRVRRRWTRWTPAALLVIIPATYAWHNSRPGSETIQPPLLVANVAVVMLLCVVVPTAVGLLVRSRRDQAAAIAELHRSRDREARLVADAVRSEERTALAREMHDVVSDKISLITVRAWSLITRAPTEEFRAEAETIRSLSKSTLEELRGLVVVLRDPSQPGAEGISAIPELVARSGLDVTLRLDPALSEDTWSAAAQRTAYRTVQEALTNVRKYAPTARTVVELTEREGQLIIQVSNEPVAPKARSPHAHSPDAPPPSLPSGGHGLIGMRERAALVGGRFLAEPTEAGGFVVEVRIPAGAGTGPT